MVDKNIKYILQSQDTNDLKDKVIIRTADVSQEERFTIGELENRIAGIEIQKASLDAEKAKIQKKIAEATKEIG